MVLARRASRRPMDAHFFENVNKIHLIFQLIYKKHAPWTANFQFLAKSLTTSTTNVLKGLHEIKTQLIPD